VARDDARAKAIAAKASERPANLIHAEDRFQQSTAELDFAESVLSQADAALRANEQDISAATQEVRQLARNVAVAEAEVMAKQLRQLRGDYIAARTKLRGCMLALMGQGAQFQPVAVEQFRDELPAREPVLNSTPYRQERELADAWREWVDAATRNPNARMPGG
jgi:hypothetical protein